jgi:RHS repeat-associated protein
MRVDQKSTTITEPRKFIGEQFDSATNLSYLNARYYNGDHGQFISQDPVARDIAMMQKMPAYMLMLNQVPDIVDQTMTLSDPQLLNSYSYSRNSPVTLSDPSGKYIELSASASGFGLSGAAGVRFDFQGVDLFVAGGTGAGFGGGPTLLINSSSLTHEGETVVNAGASVQSPFGGLAFDHSGSYIPATVSLSNTSNQVSVVFGKLGGEMYVRKERPVTIFGGTPPPGLKLTNTSRYSTPNYKAESYDISPAGTLRAGRAPTIGPVSPPSQSAMPVSSENSSGNQQKKPIIR